MRVGISPALLDRAQSKEIAISYIAKLLLWRWTDLMDARAKLDWEREVMRRGSGPGIERLFWRELDQKKVGLYGYHQDASADPMALIRHPWSLKRHEFEDARSAIADGNIPSVPDDRAHVTMLLGVISGFTGTAAIAAGSTGLGAPATPLPGTISGLTGGVAAVIVGVQDRKDLNNTAKIKREIQAYQTIYEREADFRRRE